MPAAADTAQPSDTTPPSPAVAGKAVGTGKRAAPEKQDAPADEIAAEAPEDAEPAMPAPEPGWFCNTAATKLTVLPDQYPSATLAPGEATWLPDDPRHPNLERCDAPAPDAPAADTAGSEK